ncbi:hypothetical protein V1514DRAFT_318711 [Lipomyces japonicus]|uniref:uncharacterized protein n=1 Tax=Lipomyces japonicus TaxID=56871 RepID=UPI0034CDB06E
MGLSYFFNIYASVYNQKNRSRIYINNRTIRPQGNVCHTVEENEFFTRSCSQTLRNEHLEDRSEFDMINEISVTDSTETRLDMEQAGNRTVQDHQAYEEHSNNVANSNSTTERSDFLYEISVGDIKTRALFDSGSQRNYIDPDRVKIPADKIYELERPIITRFAGERSSAILKTKATLRVDLGGVPVGDADFLIMKGMNHPIIIGREWMRLYDAGLIWQNQVQHLTFVVPGMQGIFSFCPLGRGQGRAGLETASTRTATCKF